MTEADILKERNNIITLAREAKLYEAFSSFGALLNSTPNWDISEELSRLQTSYKYMLTYMAQGMADPQKEQIYTELLASLYDLIDRYCHKTLPRYSHSLYYAIAHDFAASGASLESIFGSYSEELEKYRLYADIPTDEKDGNKVVELARNVEKGAIRLFNFVWTSFRPSQGELETLKRIMTSADTPSPLKQLLLSALLLNLNHSYDENLLSLLFDVYAQFGNTDDDIAIRAACCIFFTLHKYHYVASLSGNITSRLDELNGDKDFKDAINIITLQFIKSCDTDKLTKMVHDELLPGIMNAGAGFFKNIKRNKINPNDLAEMESNPEWEDFLEKSGFADKIKEINEIQMEGGDVFLGTFSKLKTFPFFHDIANWFIPFYPGHSVVASSPVAGNQLIMNIISHASFLCDSDRYSFCLSINSIPEAQRNAMLSQFDSQNEMLDEMKKAAITAEAKISRKQIATNYIQGLYRFFKLCSQRQDFENPFTGNILDNSLLAGIICTQENLSLIGEYYLKNKHYDLAISFFKKETEITTDYPPSILQKIGFCCQNLKLYGEAVKYYLKYDLFDNASTWNTKHLAASYKAMGDMEKALEYYSRAEALSPNDLSASLNIGHCLLELNKIDEALKYYFKVDYLAPTGTKALRPIAWCLFLQKNYAQSEEYYAKITAAGPTAEDYMNLGHLKMAQGDIKAAIAAYKNCLNLLDSNFPKFADNFNNDRKYLADCGISFHDMALVLDIIHYNL